MGIRGQLISRTWEDAEGNKHSTVEIRARELELLGNSNGGGNGNAATEYDDSGFHRLLAQVLLYTCQENIEDPEEVSLVLVVSQVAMDRFKGRKVYALTLIKEGVYLEEMKYRTVVIESNELQVIPENYPFLLISERDKRRQFIERILVEGNGYYITQAYKLYREEVRTMAEENRIKGR